MLYLILQTAPRPLYSGQLHHKSDRRVDVLARCARAGGAAALALKDAHAVLLKAAFPTIATLVGVVAAALRVVGIVPAVFFAVQAALMVALRASLIASAVLLLAL